jgi:hypothetical protein
MQGSRADQDSMTIGSRHDPLRGLVRAAVLPAALAAGLLALAVAPRAAEALPVGDLWISEVMYNPGGFGGGDDDGSEWVELFNAGSTDIDLSIYSLGWGGGDYTTGVLQLAGTITPGQYFVVGGPTSDAGNGNPAYDQSANLRPNLENALLVSDGIALFDVVAASVTPATVPVHAVIYGGLIGNLNGLMDETGAPGAVDAPFPFLAGGSSIEFGGAGWAAQGAPSAGSGNLVPVPESAPTLLVMLGLAGLAAKGSPRNRPTR